MIEEPIHMQQKTGAPIDAGAATTITLCKAHLLEAIAAAPVGEEPFFHSYLENVFPEPVYACIQKYMLSKKYGEDVQDRRQDNPAYTNRRFNLERNQDEVTVLIRTLFDDHQVKQALLRKFYVNASDDLSDALTIHKEFEFFFTKAGRFQNIHVDIPPKFLSFVFYLPEQSLLAKDEERNGTILYDKELRPHYKARFRANSACVFAPHFSSYHGFDSTVDRDVLVMFYIHSSEMDRWRAIRRDLQDVPPFTGLLNAVEAKLRAYPLIEFSRQANRLETERATCRVNAPDGRVIRPVNAAAR